jgi:hypothetical protein
VCEASQLFSDDLLKDVAIEGQVGHDLFQLAVFMAQRPELAQLLQTQPGELLFPAVERLCSLTPSRRQTSVTFSPPSTWCRAWTISSLLRPLRGICDSSGRLRRPAYEITDRFVFTFALWRFSGFGSGHS